MPDTAQAGPQRRSLALNLLVMKWFLKLGFSKYEMCVILYLLYGENYFIDIKISNPHVKK
jgi:hypothetical protein